MSDLEARMKIEADKQAEWMKAQAEAKTLRDEFAIAALPLYLIKVGPRAGSWGGYSLSDAARDAYLAAAAMIQARKETT